MTARALYRELTDNVRDYHADRISWEAFDALARDIWRRIREAGLTADVLELWRKENPA